MRTRRILNLSVPLMLIALLRAVSQTATNSTRSGDVGDHASAELWRAASHGGLDAMHAAKSLYFPGYYASVTAFGAKCDWDGKTGTDDTAALLDAWKSIQTATGGEIDLPAGMCYAPNGLNLSTNMIKYNATVTIRGAGMLASQIVTRDANIGIDLGGVNNVVLKDFTLRDVGTTARVGIARYRVISNNHHGGGGHIYEKIQVIGAYSLANLYSVGSENNNVYSTWLTNHGNGAGYATGQSNCLALSAGQAIPPSSSNTVNHFFGGIVSAGQPGTTGGAVLFCSGSADDTSFNGTYFVGNSPGYNVRFGLGPSDNSQGSKSFHGVRFEGTADALSATGSVGALTVDSGSSFSELPPGIDVHLMNANGQIWSSDIHGNQSLGRGMILPWIFNSRIQASTVYPKSGSYPATSIIIQRGATDSELEANAFSLSDNAYVTGSTLVQNDNVNETGSKKIIYGPNTATSAYNYAGSAVVMRPFGTAPANPLNGELAMADGVHWKPDGVTTQTLVQWNAAQSSWVIVGPKPVNQIIKSPAQQIPSNAGSNDGNSTPTVSAGFIVGTNEAGIVSGLNAVPVLTLTFANGGWSTWASCVANSSTAEAQPFISAINKTAVRFKFASLTGTLYYHCSGR